MSPDPPLDGLESPEALREVILAQRRELDTLRRETADVALLIDALDALLQVGDDEDPFAAVFAALEPVFAFEAALVLSEEEEPGSALRCIVATDPALLDVRWEPDRFFAKVLAGRVTATLSNEVLAAWPPELAARGLAAAQPALYLPVRFRDRRALMMLLRPVDDGFDRRHVALARKFSLLASHAFAARSANRTEHERQRLHQLTEELTAAQATLAHRANHDELTGLPNRRHLAEHVERAITGDGRPFALVFVDLDGFKQVNDLHGHQVGDALLRAVADRIRGEVRADDVVARLSGDEFLLLVRPLDGRAALDAVMERILARLREPFSINGIRILVSASAGVALHPEHGTTYEQLRRNADLAMYRAKSTRKGSAAWFDVALGRAADAQLRLEQVVRDAVRRRRFVPVFQPLVDLTTMTVVGFEALARRVDERGQLHPPGEFIEVASQLGLLDAITEVLVDGIVAQLPLLDTAFGADTSVSFNISARQATDPEAMRSLLDRLRRSRSPERFVIEVTEDAFLQAGVFQQQVFPLVREMGVGVSIDDFGTGYASLATVLELAADELKIDRAFVTAVHDRRRSQVILKGVAAAGQELGITVVAEGVETAEELAYLRTVPAITTAQGYLFARPMPAVDLVADQAALRERLTALRGVVTGIGLPA